MTSEVSHDAGPEFAAARAAVDRTLITPELEQLADALEVALVEMGFTLHACRADSPGRHLGGVCLTPVSMERNPAFAGIAVTWTQHDRRSEWAHGPASLDADGQEPAQAPPTYGRAYQEVQRTMNVALSVALAFVGFTMREFGSAGAILVTSAPEPGFGDNDQDRTDQDITDLAADPHGRI
jgi:hypothetical protein